MATARKSRFGVGLLLLLVGGCNAVRWQSAGLKDGFEMAGYFSLSVVLIVFGLWLMFRRTSRD
jgi:hypothetical protein